MQKIVLQKVEEVLNNGKADRILAWGKGEFSYDPTPAVFTKDTGFDNFVYSDFCSSNLSKYLIKESKKDGKIAVLLKPCDTYGFNQLLLENRFEKEKVYAIATPCDGKIDIEKIKNLGIKGVINTEIVDDKIIVQTIYGVKECLKKDALCDKCLNCKSEQFKAYDEVIDFKMNERPKTNRFEEVEKLEKMTSQEKFEFWRGELSRCIRCNACRNICPACTCIKCVFDNDNSGVSSKANTDEFEENMFHIIRAFHVAGRCTDCGECSRVCPQGIPLHLLNRKFIKDINEYYGEYQAGETSDSRPPLANFTKEDVEPSIIKEKGNK